MGSSVANWVVENRLSGDVVYAYMAEQPDHFIDYPAEKFNHIRQKDEVVHRRLKKLEFIARIGDSAFSKLLELSMSSVEVMKFIKMIDWATPDVDGTSIDLDDPQVQKVTELEAILIEHGVVTLGWSSEVLA